jgi:hypothetical protein
MHRGLRRNTSCAGFAALVAAALASCSGSGGSGEFQITNVNLADGQVWQINRPIKVSFSQAVDPLSVNLNTFNVRQVGGGPAAGEFYFENSGRTIVFQPLCPTLDDLSDAGLHAGVNPLNNDLPFVYELNVIGADENSQLPIRSSRGDALTLSQARRFTTPVSLNPLNLYLDAQVGPPTPLILGETLPQRVQGILNNDPTIPQDQIYSFVEVGGPSGTQHYFRRDVNGDIELVPPIELPLNKLSDPASRVELVLNFDQPVNPAAANISSNRLRWEFANNSGPTTTWVPLATNVVLERNCSQIGARVRISPRGALPPSTTLRAVVTAEFTDIVGENNPNPRDDFAIATSEPFPTNPPLLADHVLENFDSTDNEDAVSSFAEPRAEWNGNGELRARFSFTGTGGPGGVFDWYIAAGQNVIFNTTNTTISGGTLAVNFNPNFPNDPTWNGNQGPTASFQPTGNLTIVGGVVDVRNFYIEQGGTLKIEGPNPFVLLASGDVWIRGEIIATGNSNLGVNTLNTTNIPEPGSPGHAGGGRGGTGSALTTASTPRGGNGFGAFNVADKGGQGGETGWSSASAAVERRRGAGGGGGRLGADVLRFGGGTGTFEQRRIGYDAEPGFENTQGDNGSQTGSLGPLGGAIGPAPFSDPDPNNNYFGVQFTVGTGAVTIGELTTPWAGAGGGAGGDASFVPGGTFPGPWSPAGDEKGAGGAGGGGSVHVLALGSVLFGGSGRLVARGGIGGGGENTSFLNRVGGGSGGGSGGHVVLQCAGKVDFRAKTPVNVDDTATSAPNAPANNWAINVLGGQGGAGNGDLGGGIQSPTGQRETLPTNDACPPGYPTTGVNGCRGQVHGAGGDGGPGLIQLHTSNGAIGNTAATNDVLIPAGTTLDRLCAPAPVCPTGANGPIGTACYMLPTFGRTSRARSKWIALGDGGFNEATGLYRDVEFDFGGVNTATGSVLTTSDVVDIQPSILATSTINIGGSTAPYIANPGGRTLVINAATLLGTDNEALLDNPALLHSYAIQLDNGGGSNQRFDVVTASYDAGNQELTLVVDGDGPSMLAFPGLTTNTDVSLHPAYFRIVSSGAPDLLPAPADVQIRFQATRADALTGLPDPGQASVFTSDVATLNTVGNGDWRFVRFEVLFDIGPLTSGQANNAIPAVQFFRLPFLYR